MDELHMKRSWQLSIQCLIYEVTIDAGHCLLPCLVCFGQVEANQRKRVLLEKASKMPPCRRKFRVFSRIEHYVWLWVEGLWNLRPKSRDGTSYLHE